MERRIYDAAVEGSVISLLNLLQEDPLVLDRFMVGCYAETPLHIASMLGHLDFVQEILNRKPKLAEELDSWKLSPLHIATAKGFLDIVKILLSVNSEMCFAHDRDGRNPLHIATIKGRISVLRELVNVRPQAARMLIDHRGETILHLCVRYSQLGDFEVVGGDNWTFVVPEVIEYLIIKTAIEVNAINAYGFTALDLSTQSSRKDEKDLQIVELLRCSGSKHTKDIHLSAHELGTTQMARTLTSHENDNTNNALQPQNKGCGNVDEKKNDWVEKTSSALMIVASLIATMAFQVAVNPPGGVWQDEDDGTSQSNAIATGSLDSSPPIAAFPGSLHHLPHTAGMSIFADKDAGLYSVFMICDTTSFLASLSIILLLISGLPIGRKFFMWILMVIMWIAISAMSFTYAFAVSSLSNLTSMFSAVRFVILVWIGLMGLLLLVHTILLIVKMIKYVKKSIRQRRQPSGNTAGMNISNKA
ncbi:hypothetical protein EZV62_013195 [Acer yangbiense]|uniref:PGG domain-containing protein n=1 Tax=Acer yangbiense TaxID=1000413 RepID=A0A5C7I0C3_9ROSI|nr:hypothetical protein EZV62_013195 [Acer yangbiense]